MRFPLTNQLGLPVTFERIVAGALHRDGRRYLPQLVFRLASDTLIGVVDRHHYIDQSLVGQHGTARLVYLLSEIALQPAGSHRQGIVAEHADPQHISTAPAAFGRVVAVPSWELRRGHLPYESLYAEVLLDVGDGVVGVRTSLTADNMAARIGAAQIVAGDWLRVERSRIDILSFSSSTVYAASRTQA